MMPAKISGNDNNCPSVNQPNATKPFCQSGSRKNSTLKRNTPYNKANNPDTAQRGRGLLEKIHNTKNNTTPSRKNSYNCEGCRGNGPPVGKIIAHGTSVTRPHNSPLIKLPIRPAPK